jgi:hypothetical protein
MLASTNVAARETAEAQKKAEDELKPKEKKKSIKNLFGLLSFGSKTKTPTKPAEPPQEGEGTDNSSPDKLTIDPTAAGVGGNGDRSSIATTLSTENSPCPSNKQEETNTNNPSEGGNGENPSADNTNNMNNPILDSPSNPRRASLKLRSKSIHRVTSMKVHTAVNLQIAVPTSSSASAAEPLTPSSTNDNYHLTTEDNSIPSPLASPYVFHNSGSGKHPLPSVNSFQEETVPPSAMTTTSTTFSQLFPTFEKDNHEELVDNHHHHHEESLAPNHPPILLPVHNEGELTPLPSSTLNKHFHLEENENPDNSNNSNNNNPTTLTPTRPRTDSYNIIDNKGRQRSITALTAGAPLPPPPPEELEKKKAEEAITSSSPPPILVQTPDGRRLSIKILTPGAPLVMPPPAQQQQPVEENDMISEQPPQQLEEEEEPEPETEPVMLQNHQPIMTTNNNNSSVAHHPPPPPPPRPLLTSTATAIPGSPVVTVETGNGKRLSIKVLTPGAPIVPPPPPQTTNDMEEQGEEDHTAEGNHEIDYEQHHDEYEQREENQQQELEPEQVFEDNDQEYYQQEQELENPYPLPEEEDEEQEEQGKGEQDHGNDANGLELIDDSADFHENQYHHSEETQPTNELPNEGYEEEYHHNHNNGRQLLDDADRQY